MTGGTDAHHLLDWLQPGVAFFLAVLGWVWHAARLASKVDTLTERVGDLTRRLEGHVADEERVWEDTQSWREQMLERVARTREDIARLETKRHRFIDDDE